MGYVADITLLAIATLLIYSYRRQPQHLPFIINSVSITLIIRSVLILLTPVNNSFGTAEYWDLFSFTSYPSGMFPSGHTACAFLSYLFVKSNPNHHYRRLMAILLLIEIIALITSHGHYSIDIIGGLMLAYIIYRQGQDFQSH